MLSMKIENLRCFIDSDFMNISPITLLLGANSSGKSSFLRVFPLLKQSVEAKTDGPFLWYGPYVDYGSLKEVISRFSKVNSVGVSFTISHKDLISNYTNYNSYRSYYKFHMANDVPVKVNIGVVDEGKSAATYVCRINIYQDVVTIKYDKNSNLLSYDVNGSEYVIEDNKYIILGISRLIPNIYVNRRALKGYSRVIVNSMAANGAFVDFLADSVRNIVHGNTYEYTVYRDIIPQLIMLPPNEFLTYLKKIKAGKYWYRKVRDMNISDHDFISLRNAFIADYISELLPNMDSMISDMARYVSYMGPLRATAERYYRIQDLSVEEVDFQGKNLPLILKGMTDKEKSDFTEWTMEHFGFELATKLSGGHLSMRIRDKDSEEWDNVADMGFGLSQILPIIVQTWLLTKKRRLRFQRNILRILAIEQPELHLHPEMQAKLAEMIAKAVIIARERGIELKVLLETHSKIMLNKVGHLVYMGVLKKEDVNIVLFENEHKGKGAKVWEVGFNGSGELEQWPYGFMEPRR